MKNVLVTGGGGFVGGAIVGRLVDRGCRVLVLGRHRYRRVEEIGATCLVGDIADPAFLRASCRGIDTVFHTAAKAGIWGGWRDYYRTNVAGTRNVIAACTANSVERLIHTSTPSVVFDRTDIRGGDERLPYPSRFLCHYARSKALAEQDVLAADGPFLRSCAIRPHLVWGPGDPHLVPRLLERGRKRALKIIGSGDNLVDLTYIDNVAHAHILAAEGLENGAAAGQAYFIGQERPVKLWDWINDLYRALGIPEITTRLPFRLARLAGTVLEAAHLLAGSRREPKMTRFLAEQLARSHYFSHRKAASELGYEPIVSLEEGQKRLMDWLKCEKDSTPARG